MTAPHGSAALRGDHRRRQRDCSGRRGSTPTRCSRRAPRRHSASTLRAKSVVGDRSRRSRAASSRQALDAGRPGRPHRRASGPTDDDLTRDVVAEVLGLPLDEDAAIVAGIEARFARRGLRMPAVNRRQAMVPRGATRARQPERHARPGCSSSAAGTLIVLLPGPPREMKPMFEPLCVGAAAARADGERFYPHGDLHRRPRPSRTSRRPSQPIYAPLATAVPPIETTILAAPGQIELHLTARLRRRRRRPRGRWTRARDQHRRRARRRRLQHRRPAAGGSRRRCCSQARG